MTTDSGPPPPAVPSPPRRRVFAFAAAGLLAFAGLSAVLFVRVLERRLTARATDELQRRWPGASLEGPVRWRWPARVVAGPVIVRADDGRAVLRIERMSVWPRLRSLLAGAVVPGRMRLDEVVVDGGEDGRALSALNPAAVPSSHGDGVHTRARLDVLLDAVTLRLTHGAHDLAWGPWRIDARRDEEGWHAVARAPGSGRVEVTRQAGGDTMALSARQLPLAMLQGVVPSAGLKGATLDADGHLSPGRWNGVVAFAGVFVDDARFASEPVGPFAAAFEGAVSWGREPTPAAGVKGRLRTGSLSVDLRLDVHRAAQGAVFELDMATHEASFASVLSALPPSLHVEPADELDGPLSASLHASGDPSDRPHWTLEPKLDLSSLRREGRRRPLPLRETFVHRPLTAEGRGRPIVIGPANPLFVPLASVPPVLVRSVLLSEDAGFYGHAGFEFSSLVEHLLKEREEGELVRGGSTLTQQLAKNLYLSREKSYHRKAREALATVALEAQLGKDRLLELYLNTIEWGPDVYGVGEAARHYFAKPAQELTALESAFLATIIPNPVRFHAYCTRGALTEVWTARVAGLLAKLHDAGDLTEEAWSEASRATLVFHHPGAPSAPDGDGDSDAPMPTPTPTPTPAD